MNKKGFTLIELLAVIIILAIVALIATPIIFNVVEDAKKSAGESEANMVLSGINTYCEQEKMGVAKTNYCQNEETIKQNIDKMVNLGKVNKDSIDIKLDSNKKITKLTLNSNGKDFELNNGKMEIVIPIESKGFKDDSWETIQKIVKSGKAKTVYYEDLKQGTLKPVKLGAPYNKEFNVRIANLTTKDCQTEQEGFSQTACGFVVEFMDIIDDKAMDSSGGNAVGWPTSDMYKLLNNQINSIFSVLPEDLKNVMIDTYTLSSHGSTGVESNFISNNKLYLLSPMEVWGENLGEYDTASSNTKQLEYYVVKGVTLSNKGGAIKNYQGSAGHWWLRSSYSNYGLNFFYVNEDGDMYGYYAHGTNGVAPAFRIG